MNIIPESYGPLPPLFNFFLGGADVMGSGEFREREEIKRIPQLHDIIGIVVVYVFIDFCNRLPIRPGKVQIGNSEYSRNLTQETPIRGNGLLTNLLIFLLRPTFALPRFNFGLGQSLNLVKIIH